MRRTITFAIAILIGFVFAAEAAVGKPKKNKHAGMEISLISSNGENISGEIIRVGNNRVFVRSVTKSGRGKNTSVLKANIAEILPLHLQLPLPTISSDKKSDAESKAKDDRKEDEKPRASSDAAKAIAAGREFLKLNHPELAEVAFNIAIQRNKKLGNTICQIYTDADKKIPKEFQESSSNNSKTPLRLFILPTRTQIENCMEKANRWGKQMKKIAPETHTIETEHFIIYSSWSRSNDKKLASIYEKLYRTLCKQFTIPKEHNIWIGKFPVFAFWKRHDFANFCEEVLDIPASTTDRAAGFMGQREEYRFVVLGPVKENRMSKTEARNWFFELLVIESTHAFLSRYISSKHVASWLNEGIAETITADLLPKSRAAIYIKKNHRYLKGVRNDDLMEFLEARNIPLSAPAYATAQSLVRFLVKTSKKKFIKMIKEIKSGRTDSETLKSAYGMTYESLLRKWKRKIR
jgi:hypothetical protein